MPRRDSHYRFASSLSARALSILLGTGWIVGVAPIAFAGITAQQAASKDEKAAGPTILDNESYVMPPKEIADYLDLPRHLVDSTGTINPTWTMSMAARSTGLPKLADLAKPYDNLAGLMIDFKANRARSMTMRGTAEIIITTQFVPQRVTKTVPAPKGATWSNPAWSPDGKWISAVANFDDSSHLYLIEAATGKERRLTKRALNAVFVRPVWSTDGVFAVVIPEKRGPIPTMPSVAEQPRVQVADPTSNKLRTYRSLIKSRWEQARFEYLTTGQLVKIDPKSGKETAIGEPKMIESIDAAPKGDFVRVSTIQKPFSYIVPFSSFGRKEEVVDLTGKSLVTLSERKLRTGDGGGDADAPAPAADPSARRNLAWAPDGNGFTYITTDTPAKEEPKNDGEDEQGRAGRQGGPGAGTTANRAEKLVRWVAPFGKDNVSTLATSATGFSAVTFTADMKSIAYTQSAAGNTSYVLEELGTGKKTTVYSYKTSESKEAPGTWVTKDNENGVATLHIHEGTILFRGTETSNDPKSPVYDAPRPYLNKVVIGSGKLENLWKSDENAYETVDSILSPDGSRFIINRQTATSPVNEWIVEGGKKTAQLTQNQDLAPDITMARRYKLQVTRADGFKFWVRVTAPASHVPGTKLPAFFWFYPREFVNQAAYDQTQRGQNKNLFPSQSVNAKSVMIRRGWAVVEPDCPIVAPAGRMNDNYINDLRNNLSATIDTLDSEGIADRTKLAIGGHSYGGFSTANAMIHTPFFKAGIAGAGNYNRSLTPMSFQSEPRTLFEAREMYVDISAIFHAETLSGALLMYAGMDDQNVGTDPTNSERMFHVLESIGKTASLYMYPYEDHGQIARETMMDMWARHIAWLDKYVLGK